MIYMQKIHHAVWLRACQLIPNSAESWNSVQKVEIERKKLKLNWLTGKSRERYSQMANQIFCCQIKRTPWMAQFIAQFFPDCVIRVRFFWLTISIFFIYILLISNHIIFLVQIEFSDLVALKKKLPNTSFVPLFPSNWYMNSNRDLRVYRG